MQVNDYNKILEYIENYWNKTTFSFPKDKGIYVGVPYKFVSPNALIYKCDIFYWDSYFIILGLVASNQIDLAKNIIDNFVYLFKRFGIIPMRNRFYNVGISQPPFLTSMIREVFKQTNDKKWLRQVVAIAERELKEYWMLNDPRRAETHLVHKGLSRYCDHHITHLTSEHESGWDMTSRFNDHCLNFLPIDLNTLLYKYEKDLEYFYALLGNKVKALLYKKAAGKRRRTVNQLSWDGKAGFFFDYDYVNKKRSSFFSLAGFYPMWTGLATAEQAARMVKHLADFEYRGGLATSQPNGLSKQFKQWDYPNGWPNLHWLVVIGLMNYGYKDDARRIVKKWMDLNVKMFKKTGKIWEKYNVVKGDIGKTGRYPCQDGFGWTNAVFFRFYKDLIQK